MVQRKPSLALRLLSLLVVAPLLSGEGVAQVTTQLSENSSYVGACRQTRASTPVFEDARLTKSAGAIAPGTQVTLTGVVGSGIAQIKVPEIGWVEAANLQTNCDPSPPSEDLLPGDIDTNPTYCRRLRSSAIDGPQYRYLDAGLVAFDQPGGLLQQYQGQPDGPGRGATVRLTKSPAQIAVYGDRDWIRVKYTSRAGTQRLGWISLGSTGGLRSLANCLAGSTR
ncbi:MAG TPA: hypothetical protein IGS53_01655 [Leptolyngbyaceae cyanobacterium M33_DOE_097]|uniref:SH3 domain-containing protein n=1 Tax=Oscillatoriales cyanobacterium SpSt-418 TaxID=2282169 RepID=A0A7C3KEC8_9CYAN|nr:hypothetical protein [Leptolyngbyaceae cyanobacterium M33_DOE_097]